MVKTRGWILAVAAGLALVAAQARATVNIDVECALPDGGTSACSVVLNADGEEVVGGMQNDLLFDNTKVNLSGANKCRINSEIGFLQEGCQEDPIVGPCKNLSTALNVCGGDPQPPGCPDGSDGTTSRFRGIVAATAFPNTNPIPNGSVLYTCTFDVTEEPAAVTNSNIVVSDPEGTRIDDVGGSDGQIGEGGEPTPEPTEEPTAEPTEEPTTPPVEPTATPEGDVRIIIDDVEVAEGATTAVVNINLLGMGQSIGGMQNDILFDNTKISLSGANKCRINSEIGFLQEGCQEDPIVGPCKNLSTALNVCGSDPQPPGCPDDADDSVTRFRGIIAATAFPNTNPIPDGVLYTCTFDIVDLAGGATLTNSNIVVSDPEGTRIDASSGQDGSVRVEGAVEPTDTPEPEPTDTPEPEPTDTPVPVEPTATATQTVAVETPVQTPGVVSSTVVQAAAAGARALILANASAFPAAGVIQVGTFLEKYSYGSKTGNTLNLTTGLSGAVSAGTSVVLTASLEFFDDDDGCRIAAQKSDNSRALWLIVPLLGLVVLRRRMR